MGLITKAVQLEKRPIFINFDLRWDSHLTGFTRLSHQNWATQIPVEACFGSLRPENRSGDKMGNRLDYPTRLTSVVKYHGPFHWPINVKSNFHNSSKWFRK